VSRMSARASCHGVVQNRSCRRPPRPPRRRVSRPAPMLLHLCLLMPLLVVASARDSTIFSTSFSTSWTSWSGLTSQTTGTLSTTVTDSNGSEIMAREKLSCAGADLAARKGLSALTTWLSQKAWAASHRRRATKSGGSPLGPSSRLCCLPPRFKRPCSPPSRISRIHLRRLHPQRRRSRPRLPSLSRGRPDRLPLDLHPQSLHSPR
jgi:hypothetical protein